MSLSQLMKARFMVASPLQEWDIRISAREFLKREEWQPLFAGKRKQEGVERKKGIERDVEQWSKACNQRLVDKAK